MHCYWRNMLVFKGKVMKKRCDTFFLMVDVHLKISGRKSLTR